MLELWATMKVVESVVDWVLVGIVLIGCLVYWFFLK